MNARVKAKWILTQLVNSRADIIFLQEAHFKKTLSLFFKSPIFPIQIQPPGSSQVRGVAILFQGNKVTKEKKCLNVTKEKRSIDSTARYIFLNVRIDDNLYKVASIYGPYVEQLKFLEDTLTLLDKFTMGPIILGDDLNIVTDPEVDYSNKLRAFSSAYTPKSRRKGFSPLLTRFQLTYAWRYLYPGERDYSFFSAHYQSYSRTDFVFQFS